MRIALLLVLSTLPGWAQSTRDPDQPKTGFDSIQRRPTGAAMAETGAFPCPEGQATPAPALPTRAQFLAVLDQLKREYREKADGRVALIEALRTATTEAAGTNLALPLTLMGHGPAAVTAAAWSCARRPDSATFASNLGSLLDGMGDARAGAVLAYALSLAPDHALPNANQGWYLFNRGQVARAKPFFEKAAKQGPGLGPVLLGQGLIAHCQGEHRRAIDLLTRALSISSSQAGEQALSESQEEVAQKERDNPANPTPETAPAPRRDDWTKGGPRPRVVFAEPVVPGSNEDHLAMGMSQNGAIIEGYRRAAEVLIAAQQALNPNAGGDRPPELTPTSLTVYRGDDAMTALARAQYTAYAARIRGLRAPFERSFLDQSERVGKRVAAIMQAAVDADPATALGVYCGQARPLLNGEYSKFKAQWRGTWEAEQQVIREYGGLAGATIGQIRHDGLRQYLDSERKLHLLTMVQDGPADVIGWGSIGGAILGCAPATQEAPAQEQAPPEEAGKAPCPGFLQNGIGVNLGAVSVSLDCEKIAFQAGEGLIGRFEQNYVKHEQTYYLGVGLEATAGVGPMNAGLGGSAGVFVTCSGNTIRDVGVQAGSSASVPGFTLETSGTAAIVSGPSGSFSATAGLGGLSTGLPPG